jgi:hypothetical protein
MQVTARRHAWKQPLMHGSPLDLAASVEKWLLTSGIQLRSGGVAGWLNKAGMAEFVYPEITGYYLTWLDFVQAASGSRTPLAQRNLIKARRWIVEAY